ncbi:MAG: peptidoglycan-binding protein [Tunicatimonas sp.]|uniref:peptidoglycan-binding protein n=1 Tax=Tunicatimonas sp. TaxID=1940096 RepID=UPI003C77518B
MYPYLKQGNRLPTVAAVQILLNRSLQRGETIAVDGSFGRRTRKAIIDFQKRMNLGVDGVVGRNTWAALNQFQGLQVIDTIDVAKAADIGYENDAIRNAGGNPIVNHGMSGGLKVVLNKILARGQRGRVVLLRFHGHGSPGSMGLSTGTRSDVKFSDFDISYFVSKHFGEFIARLTPMFCPFGSVEFHGCRVGAGASGKRFVQEFSRYLKVPVTAGKQTQYGGGRSTFRFEGATRSAFPGGKTLKEWSTSLAEAGQMSVQR